MKLDADSWDPRVPLTPLRASDPPQFGQYRVLGRLGSGGLGDAFLAQDGNRWVVIKAVRPGVADTDALRARLAREINAISLISSPHVAGLLGSELDAERPWFAMEFVPGITLERAVSEEGPLRPVDLTRFARSLAEAVEAVHAAGVIHRDLKPSNVMLSPKGPVLIDFGIADVTGSTRLTQEGASLGTLFWMAPEQVIGEHATKATDIHAWGLVTYFAATGQPPFTGENSVAAMYQVLNVTPTLPPGYPPDLAGAINRALAKDARRRPTIPELLGMLSQPGAYPPGAAPVSANQYWATPQPGSAVPGYVAIPPPPGAPGGAPARGMPPVGPAQPSQAQPSPVQPGQPWPAAPTPPYQPQQAVGAPTPPPPTLPRQPQPANQQPAGPAWPPPPPPGYQGPQLGYGYGSGPGAVTPVPATAVPSQPAGKSNKGRNLAIAAAGGVLVLGAGVIGVVALSGSDNPGDEPTASGSASASSSESGQSGSASPSASDAGFQQAAADYDTYKQDENGKWSKPVPGTGDWTAVGVQGLTGTQSAIRLHTYLAEPGATPFWMQKDEIGTTWGGFTDFKYQYVDATGQGQDDILVRAQLADGKWTGAVALPDGTFASFSEDGEEYVGYYDLNYADGKLVVDSNPDIKFKFDADTATFKVSK